MAMTFIQLAQKIFEEEKRPLSPSEIWVIAQNKGYDRNVGTKGKTPWKSISAQLYTDTRDNPVTIFAKVETRPKRFALKSQLDIDGGKLIESTQRPVISKKRIEFEEKDLHPFVVYYGFHVLNAFLKTIRHNRSEKKEYGEWVHPDLIGCYFPFGDWKDEVVEISSAIGHTAVRFFSFELKRELSYANLRAAFFQAVSNSSWANEGYLVAAEVATESDFRGELERLSTSFGIGIIRIDIEDPDSSELIFPARAKETIDWETVNKMTINPDVRSFLKRVKIDISSREVRKEMYDMVTNRDDLLKSIARKN